MPPLKLNVYGGISPQVDKRLLTDTGAQVAENCDLSQGPIVPLLEPELTVALPDATSQSIYRYRGSWLTWPGWVSVVPGLLAEDAFERIYYTGSGKPKVRGLWQGQEVIHDLGIPQPPALSVTVRNRTTPSWTRRWHWFYEEPDGTQMDGGDLVEGTGSGDMVAVDPGKEYHLATVPSRSSASALARFILYCDGVRVIGGADLGRVYPTFSAQGGNSDLYVDGSKVFMLQSNIGSGATVRFRFDASDASRYTLDRAWVVTYVSQWGEEGPPSEPTAVYTVEPQQEAVLTLPVPSLGHISAKRVYRTVTGDAGTDYQLILEVPASYAEWIDDRADEDAQDTLPSTNWYAPPDDLAGLVTLPGEFLAGYSGRTVWFSEVSQPHAWPAGYSVVVDDDITGLAVSGNTLVVATKSFPFLISAPDPQNTSVARLPAPVSGLSAKATIEWGGAVFWPGSAGLIQIMNGVAVNATAGYFTRDQWLAYQPANMTAVTFNDRLFLLSPAGVLILRFMSDGLNITTTPDVFAGAWADRQNDQLYLVSGRNIVRWRGAVTDGGTGRQARWRSKEWVFPRPFRFSVCRVVADHYPCTLRLRAADAQVLEISIGSDRARRLPDVRPEKFWGFEVVADSAVHEVLLGQSMADL